MKSLLTQQTLAIQETQLKRRRTVEQQHNNDQETEEAGEGGSLLVSVLVFWCVS